MKKLILEKQTQYEYEVLDMEVMPEHVHLLLSVNPQVDVIKVIGKIKGFSANVLRKEFPGLKADCLACGREANSSLPLAL